MNINGCGFPGIVEQKGKCQIPALGVDANASGRQVGLPRALISGARVISGDPDHFLTRSDL